MTLSGLRTSKDATKKLCKLEVRPDSDLVVFRGSSDETSDTKITGNIVLMISEPMQIRNIRVVLEGKRRTMHFQTEKERQYGPPAACPIINRSTFLREKTEAFGGGNLPTGNHEFPFQFTLPGNSTESIEGLVGNYITYNLKAWADKGALTRNLYATKHLRVIRTLSEDPSDMSDPQEVQGVWPDKIKYAFSTTSKAAIFGTSFSTSIELTPLLEKLRIGAINFTLKETRRIKTLPGPEYHRSSGGWSGTWKEEQVVMKRQMQIPAGSEETDPTTLLPMYKFKATWQLPKSLADCRQSVDRNDWIRVKHTVHYDVILHNPDGHLSELKAHHSMKLFISPNVPLDEHNTVCVPGGDGRGVHGDLSADLHTAPPMYGTHHLDMLYDEVDADTSSSPGTGSGSQTPENGLSRYNSYDPNDSTDSVDSVGMPNTLSASPLALDNRLRHLQDSGGSRRSLPMQHRHNHSITSTPRSDVDSPEQQRSSPPEGYFDFVPQHRIGAEGGEQSPAEGEMRSQHIEYDMDALGRMPSYEMAVKQMVRTPFDRGPPSYAAATSQPPSPNQVNGR